MGGNFNIQLCRIPAQLTRPIKVSVRSVRAKVWAMSPTLNTNAHETKNAQFSNKEEPQTRPQVTHARMGYGEARLLLDRLHAEIKSVCEGWKTTKAMNQKAIAEVPRSWSGLMYRRTRSGKMSTLVWTGFLASGGHRERSWQ